MSKKKISDSTINELEIYNADKKKKKEDSDEESDKDSDKDSDEDEDDNSKKKKKKPVKKKKDDSDEDSEYNSADSEDENENDNKQLSKVFNKSVVEWVKADNQQKELKKTTSQISKMKRTASANIINYSNTNDINTIKISDGALKLEKKESPVPMKEEILAEFLEKKLKDRAKSQKWAQEAFDSRPIKTSYSLKRIKK